MRDEEARVFKALSDSTRLEVLSLLKEGELCACRLLEKLSVTQSGLSYHMRILCEAGLVKSREEGKWTHYALSASGIEKASAYLASLKV